MNFQELLANLCHQWLLTEINHKVSKEASNLFWKISNDHFHNVYVARGGKKVPQFQQLRNKLYDEKVPCIKMDVGFQCKETGEITVLKDVTTISSSRYPPCSYRRLYEIASVDVSLHFYVCFVFLFSIARSSVAY